MDPNRFDGLATIVGEISSRRQVVKWLGGIGAAGLVAVAGHSAADAKRKKKGKKNKQKAQTCTPGQTVGSVTVPANGTAVNTPVLAAGQNYRLRATGFWTSNATHGQDAFADFELANPSKVVTTFQGTRLGLSVNGGNIDGWGSYNTNHVYERTQAGQGTAVSLAMSDVVFTDNSGSVTVDIFCA